MLLLKLRVEPDEVLWLPCPSLSHWAAYSDGEARRGRVGVPQPHILAWAWAKEWRKLEENRDTKSWRFWNNFARTEKGAQGLCGKALTHTQMEMFGGSLQFPLDLPTEPEDWLSVFCYVHVLSLYFCSLLRNFFLLCTPPSPWFSSCLQFICFEAL